MHIELLFWMFRRNQSEPESFLDEGSAGPVRWCPLFRYVELRFSCAQFEPLDQDALRSSWGIVCISCAAIRYHAVNVRPGGRKTGFFVL
jgi:hypothetical protein